MTGGPEIRFLVNLRAETSNEDFRKRVRPYGWLLPPAFASTRTTAYAQAEARRGVPVVADNGLFDDLARIAVQHDATAAPVRGQLERLWTQVGGPPIRGEVPTVLRDAARDVAATVEIQTGVLRDAHLQRSRDLVMLGLTAYVGAEDPGPGVWLRLGIGPEGMGLQAKDWRKIGRRLAAASTKDLDLTPPGMGYLPVASPQDEFSGRILGDEFARAGLQEVAIGFGALVSDGRFGTRVVINNRAVSLPGKLPMSYVGSIITLKAFLDAYRERAGHFPARLHLLGLGAPILIGLSALLCRSVPLVTIDATSPIRAAASGILYSNRPTLLKLDPDRVAAKILADRRRAGWTCPCGSCTAFHQQFPQDADSARRAWADTGFSGNFAHHLVEGEPLGDALPLLARSLPGGARARLARSARLGHNHWSLTRLCDDLTQHLRAGTFETYFRGVVDIYLKSASPSYAEAIRWAYGHATAP